MKLHIQDKKGDTTYDLETEFDLAKTLFDEALANGKMAYVKTPTGNDQVFTLTPEYDTVLIPAQAGG